jgi:hypothetical protein
VEGEPDSKGRRRDGRSTLDRAGSDCGSCCRNCGTSIRGDPNGSSEKTNPQGVVKHDWLATGRIDFATRLEDINDQSKDKTGEFKLLVEERRIVESIAGNENLEIQWRLATLSETKAVVTQYHKYLSENSLIKSIPDLAASPPSQPQLSVVASANEGSS